MAQLSTLRHSTAHVMAAAVKELFPKARLGIGPSTEDGFYYDFDSLNIQTEDLGKIEQKMNEIIKENHPFKRIKTTKKEAEKLFKTEKYKLKILNEIPKGAEITVYYTGKFYDLCEGPHVKSTDEIKAFKLLRIAGAYWKGDSKNKMLTRIYGTAFGTKEELDSFVKQLEEAEKRDHIKLGKELDLYIVENLIGKGLPLLTPRGTAIKMALRRFIEDEEIKRGYLYTDTPVLARTELYKVSGHLEHFRENMYIFNTKEDEVALRPMTCPHQYMIYKRKKWSYRDLPVRLAEIATLFRHEQSGELHGLIRIRQFTLSDAHIICREDQLESEFTSVLDLISYVQKTLGFNDYYYRFSKWDPKNKKKYVNKPAEWEKAQKIMKKIIDKLSLKYVEAEGEAAFYGPKLDVQMKNVHGKEDTIFTIQLDFSAPEKFDLSYTDEKGMEARPFVIHRSALGCFERVIAMLIENYAGKFPLWLNPTQAVIVTVADRNNDFACKVLEMLKQHSLRAEIDARPETISKKVVDAHKLKPNYIITIGDKEQQNNTLAVRDRNNKVRFGVKIDEFIEEIVKENNQRL